MPHSWEAMKVNGKYDKNRVRLLPEGDEYGSVYFDVEQRQVRIGEKPLLLSKIVEISQNRHGFKSSLKELEEHPPTPEEVEIPSDSKGDPAKPPAPEPERLGFWQRVQEFRQGRDAHRDESLEKRQSKPTRARRTTITVPPATEVKDGEFKPKTGPLPPPIEVKEPIRGPRLVEPQPIITVKASRSVWEGDLMMLPVAGAAACIIYIIIALYGGSLSQQFKYAAVTFILSFVIYLIVRLTKLTLKRASGGEEK